VLIAQSLFSEIRRSEKTTSSDFIVCPVTMLDPEVVVSNDERNSGLVG
jgi:hypothetical protein